MLTWELLGCNIVLDKFQYIFPMTHQASHTVSLYKTKLFLIGKDKTQKLNQNEEDKELCCARSTSGKNGHYTIVGRK